MTSPSDSGSTVVEWVTAPLHRFMRSAPSAGIVLLGCAAVAMGWANSPWAHGYHALWETPITVAVGSRGAQLTLHQVINDGLMAVFFFLVGLEIKREVLVGELASLRHAALPVSAAVGGMVVPALLFTSVNGGAEGSAGWGIPMATDIAFALGVLALLGDRVPSSLRVFLSALAIADDMGAVLVIALFYSGGVAWGALLAAAALLALSALANAAGVRAPWAYALIGAALWAAVLVSGVHATVAGVLLALTIPSRTRIDEGAFLRGARRTLEDFHDARTPESTVLSSRAHQESLHQLEELTEQAQPPLARLEHGLQNVVNFGIMPLFALSNAGVSLRGAGALIGSPVAIGVLLGLVLGKPIGITLAAWLAVKSGLAVRPADAGWRHIHGVAWLGGIGFTMSLFIAGLAFGGAAPLLTAAKLGTFLASMVAGLVGWVLLRTTRNNSIRTRLQGDTT
jgi:NhaA family Na+:H+ antiporter